MFSCESWEISKSTFFTEHLRKTASVYTSSFQKTVSKVLLVYLENALDKALIFFTKVNFIEDIFPKSKNW